jgi:hypothetical protein
MFATNQNKQEITMRLQNGFIMVQACDVIHLAELALRWPFQPHLKICKEIFKNKLHTYIATREFINVDNGVQYEISKFNTKQMTHKFLCNYFSSIIFMKKQVDLIESKKSYYTSRSTNKKTNEFESCSRENVNRYAPQLAYTICKHSNNTHIQKFIEIDVINEINSTDISLYDCLNEDRKSWILPNSAIWPTTSPHHCRKTRRKTKDLSMVVKFCEQQKRNGITDKKTLARLVDDFFPGLLTNGEMGDLLPAREGTTVSHHAKIKQGKKLRGII